jgi:hypothetical protein
MTKRGPTDDELRARGFKTLPPSGKGCAFIGGVRPPAKPRPAEEPAEAPGLDDDPSLDNDHVVALLRAAGVPVTRENWIGAAYGSEVPDPWTPEDECGLPEALQDWSKVKLVD